MNMFFIKYEHVLQYLRMFAIKRFFHAIYLKTQEVYLEQVCALNVRLQAICTKLCSSMVFALTPCPTEFTA